MDETNKQAIVVALVLSLIITAVGLYFYFSDPENKVVHETAVVKESDPDTDEGSEKKEVEEETVAEDDEEEEEETVADEEEETTSGAAADGWMSYTSSQGISFSYPQEVLGTDCKGKTSVKVPVKAYEDKGSGYIYLTAECGDTLETLRKKTAAVSSAENGYKQEKVAGAWGIAIGTAKSEEDLKAFVSKHYGTGGCEAGQRELLSGQKDVYAVLIHGKDWTNPADRISASQTCKVDYAYKILYAPDKGKAVSIVLGKGCTFDKDNKEQDCYKEEDRIIKSIIFD